MDKKITLATLHEATQQEIFDRCKEHLLKQNAKSVDSTISMCMYRGPNGLQCAAGLFISSEEYKEEMEDNSIQNIAYAYCSEEPKHKDNIRQNIELLQSLQYIHDACRVDEWCDELATLANSQGFNP